MSGKISVVINTLNEQENIKRAIESVKWADEIIVCDMHSEDKTVALAKQLGAKVFTTERLKYVEPARNFAISKASNEWVLVMDPDEQIPQSLADKLLEIVSGVRQIDYVKIPRKNIIFGRWIQNSLWWPDYNFRFFNKNKVKWGTKIHQPPQVTGVGIDLAPQEDLAIIHNHYQSISQYIERMERYTNIQAQELIDDGYKFDWKDLLQKPLSEFLSRFFASKGFEEGIHGLVLSLLQAFSFLVVYLKVWEQQKFKQENIEFNEIKTISKQAGKQVDYWLKYGNLSGNPFKRFLQKAKNKF